MSLFNGLLCLPGFALAAGRPGCRAAAAVIKAAGRPQSWMASCCPGDQPEPAACPVLRGGAAGGAGATRSCIFSGFAQRPLRCKFKPTVSLPRWPESPGVGRGAWLPGPPVLGRLLPFHRLPHCHPWQCHGEAHSLCPLAWPWDRDPETPAHVGAVVGLPAHRSQAGSPRFLGRSPGPRGGLERLHLPSCFP